MKDGIYKDMDIDTYHANRTHKSSTILKKAKVSMKHMWWYLNEEEDKRKTHFDFGNAFELALIDPKGYEECVATKSEGLWKEIALKDKPTLKQPTSSKVYKELKEKFISDNKDKYIISEDGPEGFTTLETMIESCNENPNIKKILENIEYQNSCFWTHKSGLRLKTRPDICQINKNVLVDIKTSRDASPEQFRRDLSNNDYPLQAIMQIEGVVKSGLMKKVDEYFWLVVEKNAPYSAQLYRFDRDMWADLQDSFDSLCNRVKKAEDEKRYPGYSDRADNKYGIITAPISQYYQISPV